MCNGEQSLLLISRIREHVGLIYSSILCNHYRCVLEEHTQKILRTE